MAIKEPSKAIEITNLSYVYSKRNERVRALHHINLSINKSEITVITGTNGSGKTTLIKHLNGILLPQEGEVKIFDTPITKKNHKEIRKKVGLVFQNPEEQLFFPIVQDDILFGPRNLKFETSKLETRLTHVTQVLGIKHLLHRNTFNLSLGEKKRVAIAGILAINPEIIVLDEPTSELDPWVKPQVIESLKALKADHTLIIVSHDFEIMKLAQKIILLSEGTLKKEYSSFEKFFDDNFSRK